MPRNAVKHLIRWHLQVAFGSRAPVAPRGRPARPKRTVSCCDFSASAILPSSIDSSSSSSRASSVLTGETGAGKSILVGAVGLLAGGRASADLVRTGEELATVEAIFETDDRRELIVRREISAQGGRSRAFVDGALTTSAALRELAAPLVDLHGQHEHQVLLDPSAHLDLLDEFAGLTGAATAGRRGVRRVAAGPSERDALLTDERREGRARGVPDVPAAGDRSRRTARGRRRRAGRNRVRCWPTPTSCSGCAPTPTRLCTKETRRHYRRSGSSGAGSASSPPSMNASARTSTRGTGSRRSSRTWRSSCGRTQTGSTPRRRGFRRSRIAWRCSSV